MRSLIVTLFVWSTTSSVVQTLLYQQPTETREVQSLDGLWWFVREPSNSLGIGFANKWYEPNTIRNFENATKLPVPSAFNDLLNTSADRDHIGWSWYETSIQIPGRWKNERVVLRFGSVNYYAKVFIDGQSLGDHEGGHLPFEFDISDAVTANIMSKLTVTVAVNNTLSHETLPPGDFTYKTDKNRYPDGFFEFKTGFDFFNYAGILRPVVLYTTSSRQYMDDVIVHAMANGTLRVQVSVCGSDVSSVHCHLQLSSRSGKHVNEIRGIHRTGHDSPTKCVTQTLTMNVDHVKLWWPRGMGKHPFGYLYSLKVSLFDTKKQPIDIYDLDVGFRDVSLEGHRLLINGQSFYCKGFGMHEDADLRGRGFDWVTMTKDLNLLEWTGANCFRSSHYPYAEQRYMEADRRGIVLIDETPAVGARYFTTANLAKHKQMLTEMITRDRNHPSIIAWSISNEPQTQQDSARPYYSQLIDLAHKLDATRLVTMVYGPTNSDNDKTADLIDFICVNRYYGWYIDMGYTETIQQQLYHDLLNWHQAFNKSIMMTEYGAGAVAGLNSLPASDFTESYQVEVIQQTHLVFDRLTEQHDFFIGEMLWNFADFMTGPGTTRVYGNKKGAFTRERQPKMAAYVMRQRYTNLHLDDCHKPIHLL